MGVGVAGKMGSMVEVNVPVGEGVDEGRISVGISVSVRGTKGGATGACVENGIGMRR